MSKPLTAVAGKRAGKSTFFIFSLELLIFIYSVVPESLAETGLPAREPANGLYGARVEGGQGQ